MISGDALLAAQLLVIDPSLGGLAVTGAPGSGKSALLQLVAAAFPRVLWVPPHPGPVEAAALAAGAGAGAALAVHDFDLLAPAIRASLLNTAGVLLIGGAYPDRCAFWLELPAGGDRLTVLRSDGAVPPLAQPAGDRPLPPLSDSDLLCLCTDAVDLGVTSQRADFYAARAARAHAALHGRREVTAADMAAAVRLVLAPRAPRNTAVAVRGAAGEPPADAPSDTPSDTPPDDMPLAAQPAVSPDTPDTRAVASAPRVAAGAGGTAEAGGPNQVPAAEPVHMPPLLRAVIAAAGTTDRRFPTLSAGGRGRSRRYGAHGVPVQTTGVLRPGPRRVSVAATLRAALPWQGRRGRKSGRPLVLHSTDLRVWLCRRSPQELLILVADASGSMADSPVRRAKGAVAALLQEAYRRRAQVALVACRGQAARLLTPPGKNAGRATRALAALPAGGATPLAGSLAVALALTRAAVRRGPCRCALLLVTDGRANRPLQPVPAGMEPTHWLQAELQSLGGRLRAEGVASAVLEPRPGACTGGSRAAAALARTLGAWHVTVLPRRYERMG